MENDAPASEFIDPERLKSIRKQTDWQALFWGLGLERDAQRSTDADWWAHSPFAEDPSPTFHMTEKGLWYDFSIRKGGGVIELVQQVCGVNCYDAGRMILENGWLLPNDGENEEISEADSENPPALRKNPPIRQDLRPALSEQGTHAEFQRRGISEKTCKEMGCGFLASGRSPLKNTIVFQVRGVEESESTLRPAILSQIGWNPKKEGNASWITYKNFDPSLELYNLDQLLLNAEARAQVEETGRVLVVDDPWDVVKCREAGIYNVVSSIGSSWSAEFTPEQIERIGLIQNCLNPESLLIWNHRGEAGRNSQANSRHLQNRGISVADFDWNRNLSASRSEKPITIPEEIGSPCDMSIAQLQWLRKRGIV